MEMAEEILQTLGMKELFRQRKQKEKAASRINL